SSIVVPCAGDSIDVTRVPREVAEDELRCRRSGDFRGLDWTQISGLRPNPVGGAPNVPHTDVIEPKRHVIADTIGLPTGFYIHICGVSVISRAMEHVQSVGDIFVQGPVGLGNLASVGYDRTESGIARFQR